LYVGLIQAESKTVLNSLLIGLNGLQKPQLLVTENHTFPLHLKLGYQELDQQILDDAHVNPANKNQPIMYCI
jgi:hypothetical protein